MDPDPYKGESAGKKFARYAYWQSVALEMGTQFNAGKHLFLASREGGDFGVLRSLGLPFDLLVGIDRNEDAIAACHEKWERVAVSRGEVAPVCQAGAVDEEVGWYVKNDGPLASVFLDFCCHMDRASLLTATNVFLTMQPGSIFGVAFLKGREKLQRTQRIANLGNRRQRRALKSSVGGWRSDLIAMLDGRLPWDMLGLMQQVRECVPEAAVPRIVRWRIMDCVLTAASKYREPENVGLIEYHSRTKDGAGVPMLMMLFRVRWRDESNRRRAPWHIEQPKNVDAWVKETAVKLGGDRGALAMNVDSKTVAAWKAHTTRGTYREAV